VVLLHHLASGILRVTLYRNLIQESSDVTSAHVLRTALAVGMPDKCLCRHHPQCKMLKTFCTEPWEMIVMRVAHLQGESSTKSGFQAAGQCCLLGRSLGTRPPGWPWEQKARNRLSLCQVGGSETIPDRFWNVGLQLLLLYANAVSPEPAP